MSVWVATRACAGCGACLRTCPEHALRAAEPGGPGPIVTLVDRCTGYGECMEVCPVDALVELEAAA